MAQKAHRYVYPDKKLTFQYTTSSIEPAEEARRGVSRSASVDASRRGSQRRQRLSVAHARGSGAADAEHRRASPAAPRRPSRRGLRRSDGWRRHRPRTARPRSRRGCWPAASSCGQALRIGHGGEVAVVGGAHPARARRIGPEFARPAGRRPADRSPPRRIGVGSVSPSAEKQARSNSGSCVRARADAVLRERRLMRVDEGHAVGRRIAAELAVAQRDSALIFGRNSLDTKSRHAAQPLAVGAEGRMHVEAVAPAGAGRARRRPAPDGRRRRTRRARGCRRPAA